MPCNETINFNYPIKVINLPTQLGRWKIKNCDVSEFKMNGNGRSQKSESLFDQLKIFVLFHSAVLAVLF